MAKTAKIYEQQLREEVNAEREKLGKKRIEDEDDDEKANRSKGFRTHLETLLELFYETHREKCANLGRKPDDLVDVLADMAIAAPAICINRTYRNYLVKDEDYESYML